MAQHLALLSLLVDDYSRALDFYVGKMGFELVEDSDLGGGKRWVVVSPGSGGSRFLLAKASDERQVAAIGGQGGGRVWLFLHTDSFEADHSRLSAAGVRFLEEPRHEAYGSVAVFEDVYGNRWDLLQPRKG
ncbi:MAG: VOC family protein [Caulobacter sp.]|nr:VOC family protein [Caulobacter sp.]